MSNKTFEVIHSIFGIEIDTTEPIRYGDFTFYQFPRDREVLVKKYFDGESPEITSNILLNDPKDTAFISVRVDALDINEANRKAEYLFLQITNLLNFLLSEFAGLYGVTILNNRKAYKSTVTIMAESGKDYTEISTFPGIRGLVPLSRFPRIGEADSLKKLIENVTRNDLTEIEKKLKRAIDFCGMATQNIGQPIGYIAAVTSLECLFSINGRNISQSISENYALIMKKDFTSRIRVRDELRTVYSIRSKIAHGEISMVSTEESLLPIQLAEKAIRFFYLDKTLSNLKTEKDLMNYIDYMKFQMKEDIPNA